MKQVRSSILKAVFEHLQIPITPNDITRFGQVICFTNVLRLSGVPEPKIDEMRHTLAAHKINAAASHEIGMKYGLHMTVKMVRADRGDVDKVRSRIYH
jgi:hypothetical protein